MKAADDIDLWKNTRKRVRSAENRYQIEQIYYVAGSSKYTSWSIISFKEWEGPGEMSKEKSETCILSNSTFSCSESSLYEKPAKNLLNLSMLGV